MTEKTNEDIQRIEEECESNEYVLLYLPKHPMANKAGYVPQHRYVMEQAIGRYLLPREVVHHIDLDKSNNDIDNLLLFESNGEHVRFHNYGYANETVEKLIEDKLICKNINGAYRTGFVGKFKCTCQFCGDTFTSRTKENPYCSTICFNNAALGNEMPTKAQMLEWLNKGYTKYKLIQLLEISKPTLNAYFRHYRIDYDNLHARVMDRLGNNKSTALEDYYDRLAKIKINIRDPKDLSIQTVITGVETFISWLIDNNYTQFPNNQSGRRRIRERVYDGLFKRKQRTYGFIIDSPNVINELRKLRNGKRYGKSFNNVFATQQQYNQWIEMVYLMQHYKKIQINSPEEDEKSFFW